MLNVNKEKIIFNLHIIKNYKIKLEEYDIIYDRIEALENKLNERKKELEEIKTYYNNTIIPEINSYIKGKKININCIYLDENINAEEEFCSSYEFFKILKNSISGVFFGIKDEQDYYYLNTQIPEELNMVLIYSTNDYKKANDFIQRYHSKFYDIIIFTIDPKEFADMKEKFSNVISIESDYDSLILKLIHLKFYLNDDIDKYKPYDLNLYSDYENKDIIRECHHELLKNTILGQDEIQNNDFQKGLTYQEYLNFISFLDDDLDDRTPTEIEEEKNYQQFNINPGIEDEINEVPDINIIENVHNNFEKRGNNEYELRKNNEEDDLKNIGDLQLVAIEVVDEDNKPKNKINFISIKNYDE